MEKLALVVVVILAGCGGTDSKEVLRVDNGDGTTTVCDSWEYKGEYHTECKLLR